MGKIYFYQVVYIVVNDHEEFQEHQNFTQVNLVQSRNLAFSCFEEVSNIYYDQFLNPHPLIESFISISLVQDSDDYDFDNGMKIETRRQDFYPLYRFSKGKIKKNKTSFKFEQKVIENIPFLSKGNQIDELYNESREIEIISKIENGLNKDITELEKNLSLNFYEVKCYKCRKSMEINSLISDYFNKEKNLRSRYEPKICCNDCIETFYKGALAEIRLGVYDKNGKSLHSQIPDLGKSRF